MVLFLPPLLLLCLAPLAAAAPAKPKHIIMLVIDDYGFADASYKAHMYNGTAPPPTPHLDELAMAGVRLESHCKANATRVLSAGVVGFGADDQRVPRAQWM